MKFKILLFSAALFSMYGCVDTPNFPDVPSISYNGISQETQEDSTVVSGQKEVVTITINIEDGDGDLGASAEDVQKDDFVAAYKKVPGWGLPANYELTTMTKQSNGTFTSRILEGDSTKFFPVLRPDGKKGPVKAKLDLIIPFPKGNTSRVQTLKFKVRIIDRAFNISKSDGDVITDEVQVPVSQ